MSVLQDAVFSLYQRSLYGTFSPIIRIHESGKQGVDVGVSLANVIPNNQLTKVLLSVSEILSSATFDVLFPKG